MRELAVHAIIDAWGADPDDLDDPDGLEQTLTEAVLAAGATVVTSGNHRHEDGGAAAWVILSDSHAAVRTYPAEGRWLADFLMAGDADPEDAVDMLLEALGGDARVSSLSRG